MPSHGLRKEWKGADKKREARKSQRRRVAGVAGDKKGRGGKIKRKKKHCSGLRKYGMVKKKKVLKFMWGTWKNIKRKPQ